jgi:hypothetical protein
LNGSSLLFGQVVERLLFAKSNVSYPLVVMVSVISVKVRFQPFVDISESPKAAPLLQKIQSEITKEMY